MDRESIKKIINESINKANESAEQQISEQLEKFQESRGGSREGYEEKILKLYGGEVLDYNIEDFINKFYDLTGIDPYMFTENPLACIDDEEILEQLDDKQQQSVKEWLDQETQKEISLQEIATLIRLKNGEYKNEEKKQEAERIARRKSEEYGESYESRYEKELADCGYKYNIEDILSDIISDEEYFKKEHLECKMEADVKAPKSIIQHIADDMGLEVENIELSEKNIKTLQFLKSKKREEYLDFVSMKVELGTMNITKQVLDDLVKVKETDFSKKYAEQFNEMFQGFLGKYAKTVALEDMDAGTMQILYENSYQGEFSTPQIKSKYTQYCEEQEQKAKQIEEQEKQKATIAEKDNTIAEQSAKIGEQEDTIAEKDEKIAEKDKKIKEQEDTIAEKDEKIAEKDEKIAEKDKKIEEQKEKIEQSSQERIKAENEIARLRSQVAELEKQNSNQLIVIRGLQKRSQSLENIIEMQKRCIESIMGKFMSVKAYINDVIANLEPKTFAEKMVARFTRKKDSMINQKTHDIINITGDAEQEYKRMSIAQSGSIESEEVFVRNYAQQHRQHETQKRQQEEYYL